MKTTIRQLVVCCVSGAMALMGASSGVATGGSNAEHTSFRPAPIRLVGTLTVEGGKVLLTDPKTGVVSELRGKALERFAEMSVSVDGRLGGGKKMATAGAHQIVHVDHIATNANSGTMQASMSPRAKKLLLASSSVAGGSALAVFTAARLKDKSASRQ